MKNSGVLKGIFNHSDLIYFIINCTYIEEMYVVSNLLFCIIIINTEIKKHPYHNFFFNVINHGFSSISEQRTNN